MGLLLAILAALGFGSSDFFGGRAGRTEAAITVTRTSLLVGTLLIPLYLLVVPFRFGWADSAYGAGSGVMMATGLVLMYEGYKVSRIGVVGPSTSVVVAIVPLVYDVARGEDPSNIAMFGIALGLVALAVTTYVPGGTGRLARGLAYGVVAGTMFGLGFTLMSRTTKDAGLSTVAVQRATALLFLCIVGILQRNRLPFLARTKQGRSFGVATGVLAGAGVCLMQLALRRGPVGSVSVAASQFATVTVVLSALFNGERLRWWQTLGVAVAAAGVALMAAG